MSRNKDILLVGVGGQGTILASRIIAYVGKLNNLEVKISEVHGMAQRGGSVVTHLRMGEKVYSPLIQAGQADIIVSFEQLEGWRWFPYLEQEGMIIENTRVINPLPVISGAKRYPPNILEEIKKTTSNATIVDAQKLAKKAGDERTANVVLLGVMANYLDFEKSHWEKALENTIPSKVLNPNKEAFSLGYEHI